jgi:Xaa-Pro dipeptidase
MSPDLALQERRARLVAAMEAASVDTMLVYGNAWQGDYFRYVTGLRTLEGQGLAVAQKDGTISVFMDSHVDVERGGEGAGADIAYAPELLSQVEAVLDRGGNRAIGAAPYRLLPRRLAVRTGAKGIADHTSLLDHLLMVKSPAELAAMRKAAAMADAGYDVFLKAACVGRADYEVIADVERFYRASGVEDNFMIIGVGGPEVRGMAPPTGRRIARGDMVTTELTPCVDGYYAQICRTLVAGEPSEEQQRVFRIYLDAMEAGIAVVRPGVTAADIARAENDVMRGHGLGEYVTSEYTRVRGHGLGLFADTKPHILEDVDTVIEEDMTLIVHPNTYNPTVGYMVLGDAVIVTATGSENLIRTPRALFSVPA